MKSKKLELLLKNNEEARNCNSRQLELLYLLEYICEDELEKKIIADIYSRKFPSGATLKRARAFCQNTEGKYMPSEEVQAKRDKYQSKIQKEFAKTNLFQAIGKWFKKQ